MIYVLLAVALSVAIYEAIYWWSVAQEERRSYHDLLMDIRREPGDWE